MTQRPPSDSEITMTDLPYAAVSGLTEKSMTNEITLTTAWKAPKDGVLILGRGTPDEEWVRVTDSVGNGPYQVTVTRLTARERWSARFWGRIDVVYRFWKHRVWWPFVDFLEDAWEWLKHN